VLTNLLQNNSLAWGNTAIIEPLPFGDGDRVTKSPHPQASSYDKEWQRRQIGREYEVYQRLPNSHPRLLRMFGYSSSEGSLVLEYMPQGNLSRFLQTQTKITIQQQLQWCVEAAEAVVLLHSYNIIHADIKPENMLLDDQYGLKIIDLSGASIDGKPPLSLESTRFYLPRSMKDAMPCSDVTDLFALGSSIYQIVTRRQPYEELSDKDVEYRYARQEFPSTDIPFGDVIGRCWRCEFDSAQSVLDALVEERCNRYLP
jgi:serine/threonine protein kinase